MAEKYTEYKQLNLPGIAEEILQKWEDTDAFAKSVSEREGQEQYVFYEGPPSANGMPGIHHVISRTLKDMVCRYKTMQGYQVRRKGGWDTHGLPVELGVEKELGISKEDIGTKISVEDYNKKCREVVMRYRDKWDEVTKLMGYWVDLKEPYVTYENNYIESLWWILSELHKKGYLYESVSIQPYSPAAGTGLSSHELNQPGTYKDVKDTSATAMFKAVDSDLFAKYTSEPVYYLAWTTTPWTLPSNLGLTVGPRIDYSLVQTFNPYTNLPIFVVLATKLIGKYFKPEGEMAEMVVPESAKEALPWRPIATFTGAELVGLSYEQLLPTEAGSLENIREVTPGAEPFKIVEGDFVTTEDGTGIVHTSPAFGADDYKVGKKNNLGILTLVDKEGKFVDGVGEFGGRYVKDYKNEEDYIDVNVDIAVKLKLENRAFKVEKYEHNYPHCWRTDKPIIYYPLDAWFIKTTAVKDRMVELNKTINWKPASTGTGRFGNWLDNMVDWNLSRSRFWGTPLPIWKTEDGEEERCIGSIEELNIAIKEAAEKLGGETNKHYLHDGILDLHKPYVDDIILVSDSGQPMKRVPDLVDVWFDSGAMPYAQWHYPFENKETFKQSFPADFIAEGVDQTRGWFYTLHALGVLLFDSVAYKTVVSNGLVLDKDGNKMSKRTGNVVDPFKTMNTYGADATRWYLLTNAAPWDSLKFNEEGIKESQRKFFGTLYNTYQFFALYANVDSFTFAEKYIPLGEKPELDRWILSALNSLIKVVTENLDNYEPTQAYRAVEEFTDSLLSNWYVRQSRRRFWKGEYEADKISAYQTLYECLETIAGLIAPLAPFFADWLYTNLNRVTQRQSHENVHLSYFPKADEAFINTGLEKQMLLAQNTSSLILSLRKKVNIKVRQPLQKVLIPALNEEMRGFLREIEETVKAETNIKEIEILEPDNDFIRKKAKANFKTLGKKLGGRMKAVAAVIPSFTDEMIAETQEKGYELAIEEKGELVTITLDPEDIEIYTDEIPGYEIAVNGALTVALDVSISEELLREGIARELVNKIQNIRKDNDFSVTDRIDVQLEKIENLVEAINQYNDYICREILADSLEFVEAIKDGTKVDINEYALTIKVLNKTHKN